MLALVPSEVPLGWIYLPPVLIVFVLGISGGWIVSRILNRTGLSHYFWHPPLAMIAISVILCAVIGLFVLVP
jgi:hypothetical protein